MGSPNGSDLSLGIVEMRILENLLMNRCPMLVNSRVPVPEGVGGELDNDVMRSPYKVAGKPIQLRFFW